MRRVRGGLAIALGATAVFLLGACGGDDPATTTSAASSVGAEGAEAEDGAEAAGGDVEVCSIVPPAAAERVIGASSGPPQDASVSGQARCKYSGAEGAHLLVAYGPSSTYDTFVSGFSLTPVSGVGEKAADRGSGTYILAAVQGEHFVQFTVGGPIGDSGIGDVDKTAAREAMVESLKSL